jgi:putative transposase
MYERPARISGYDYAAAGIYFITICVQHMEARFGAIENGEIRLNAAGEMVTRVWQENIERYPGAALDLFVVMPDHMHAIVFLGTDPSATHKSASLTRIIQSFKSLTTVEYARGVKQGICPPYDRVLWQRGFHDRILRNDRELERARAYIEANPGRAQEKLDSAIDGPFV